MSATAAHLVDNVFPRVPVRQWVLSLPIRLRYILAYNADLCGQVLKIFIREVYRWYRWSAKIECGLSNSVRDVKCGSVTFIQRADSGLRLNLHFHALVMDGVFVQDDFFSPPTFYALPDPTDEAVAHVAIAVRQKVLRFLEQAGHDLGDPDAFDDFAEREPLLAACSAASVTNTIATGERAGQNVERLRDPLLEGLMPQFTGTRCVNADGFSVHANRRVKASERKQLEELCRYVARPPISNDRLQWLPDGKVSYSLKRQWSDGSSAILFEPLEFVGRLLPLQPPPMVNQIRYHGVLGPAASWRDTIVPASRAPAGGNRKRKNYSWADLMRRVFEIDVLQCGSCGGRMRVITKALGKTATRSILTAACLPSVPPPRTPAKLPPQQDFDFAETPPDDYDGWEAA